MDTTRTRQTNNGSANYDRSTTQSDGASTEDPRSRGYERMISVSEQLSPFKPTHSHAQQQLNMSTPDLLNTSMQHMSDILHSHKLLKEREYDQLELAKKELVAERDALQSKLDALAREHSHQSQRVSLLEQAQKHA